MVDITHALILLPQPLPTVIDYVTDFSNAPSWHAAVTSSSPGDDIELAAGSRWHARWSRYGLRIRLQYTLIRQCPDRVTFVGIGAGLTETVDLRLTDFGECVELHVAWAYKLHGLLATAEPVLGRHSDRFAKRSAAALSTLLTKPLPAPRSRGRAAEH